MAVNQRKENDSAPRSGNFYGRTPDHAAARKEFIAERSIDRPWRQRFAEIAL